MAVQPSDASRGMNAASNVCSERSEAFTSGPIHDRAKKRLIEVSTRRPSRGCRAKPARRRFAMIQRGHAAG